MRSLCLLPPSFDDIIASILRSPLKAYLVLIGILLIVPVRLCAQDVITGAFQGEVADAKTGNPVKNARVSIKNDVVNVDRTLKTDTKGRFFQGLLPPGIYII